MGQIHIGANRWKAGVFEIFDSKGVRPVLYRKGLFRVCRQTVCLCLCIVRTRGAFEHISLRPLLRGQKRSKHRSHKCSNQEHLQEITKGEQTNSK